MSDVEDYYYQQLAEITKRKEVEVKYRDYTQTDTVASGGSDTVTIFSRDDTIWDVISMWIDIDPPPGATVDNHEVFIESSSKGLKFFQGASTYNRRIEFVGGEWNEVSKRKVPWEGSAGAQILASMILTDSEGIDIRYVNRTDVDQTNKRVIKIAVKETTIR